MVALAAEETLLPERRRGEFSRDKWKGDRFSYEQKGSYLPTVFVIGRSAALAPALVRCFLPSAGSKTLPVSPVPEALPLVEAFAFLRPRSRSRPFGMKLTVVARIE
jgi:hypothetical protein